MKELVQKFVSIEKEIARERGSFVLFALFEREEAQGNWDIVASASWFGPDEKQALVFIVRKLEQHLNPDDLISISRVVLLDPSEPLVKAINKMVQVEDEPVELTNCDFDYRFSGLSVIHAFIITSRNTDQMASASPTMP